MAETAVRYLSYICGWAILVLSAHVEAQSFLSADQRLEDFIHVNQFASHYAMARYSEQWCYYTKIDRDYVWWYLADRTPDHVVAVKAHNGFGIPFVVASYNGAPSAGALVVGYVVKNGPPNVPLEPVSFSTSGAPDCAIGIRILSNGPYPIVGLAKNLPKQTMADPAPEYRVWATKDEFHQVRLISVIPVAFDISGRQVAGSIVLGFTGDW